MRVCIRISDGRIIASQSNDEGPLDTLRQNARDEGYAPDQVEVRVMRDAEYAERIEQQDRKPPSTKAERLAGMLAAHGLELADVKAELDAAGVAS
jgi:hypothetical protein